MRRISTLAAVFALALSACTSSGAPPRSEDPAGEGKEDGISTNSISPNLMPMYELLRNDANVLAELGPEGTTTMALKKRVKVVRYTDFGKAVDSAATSIARNYFVSVGTGSDLRRGVGMVDLFAVGDMYVTIRAGFGDDSYIDKLIVEGQRERARELASALLPEAALVQADHASTTSTGNYVLVLGDMDSGQAIVMTLEYQIE